MRVVIVYSWARDTGAASVRADGSVDWRGARTAPGEDDPAALAVARQLAEDTGGEVTGLTLGEGDASWVLARGVGSTWCVGDAPLLTDDAATAGILAAAVRAIDEVDVVVVGDAAEHAGVPAALAGLLGWPAVLGVTAASAETADAVGAPARVRATRRSPSGTETITAAPPLVLGVAAESGTHRVPGMKELLAARRRPVTPLTLAQIGAGVEDVTSRGTDLPPTAPTHVFEGPPDEVAAQLVAALRAGGAL
ncbi:hypothetical protein [Cellulomonas sp. C5510]|uniref:hypothetical protein n=1 Tax=Cellulomonas sp. C5510 TaxID=2871170 RepID=UPI001C964A0D|nr:hypothetical protein [Cellulomonas sp. C5510]QZN86666.1 hypothetical protein K5O09_05870 [Cellulomonas sp. C5510]